MGARFGQVRSAMTLNIAAARPEDHAVWCALWHDFNTFCKNDLRPGVSESTWARIMDPEHRMICHIAWQDGQALGFATFYPHPSSFITGDDCYLEDLFVAPFARGAGVGFALMQDIIVLSKAHGWHRLSWHTGTDNQEAQRLYSRFGTPEQDFRYRIDV